jgi:biotin synthase
MVCHVLDVRINQLSSHPGGSIYRTSGIPRGARCNHVTFVQVHTASLALAPFSAGCDETWLQRNKEYLVTQAATRPTPGTDSTDILTVARQQVLERGEGLSQEQVLAVLQLPDDRLEEVLALAHEVRMAWCGPEVEVEGIISLKTGGCPEDCHFCSQSGLFASPVRSAWLDIPSLVEAAKQTAKTGATEFCIVAAVRGPDERLLAQVAAGIEAIRDAVDIQIACSLGMLTAEQVDQLSAMGVHRYNHNLETARSFFPNVVTTHSWEERWETLSMVREAGMEVCCGGILGMGETIEQRAEFAANLAELGPDEVPLNFLNPRPGTPFGDLDVLPASEALKAVAAFRLALPRTMLRFAGGREITLGDLGAKQGILGGINAVIVGNYLTTLGRPAEADLELLDDLQMPIKALNASL